MSEGMYGWRARIGCIRPSQGINAAEQFRKIAPEGVQFVEAKVLYPPNARGLDAFPPMLKEIERAAREVASAGVQAIIQEGGALSMFRGWGTDKDVIAKIEDTTGIPATTHGIAEVEAIQRLDMHRIVVFTGNEESVNVKNKEYLEGAGLEVVLIKQIGMSRQEIALGSSYGLYRPVKDTFLEAPPADGLVILTGALRTLEIIQPLEYDLRKPVVTACQAALWKVLNMVNVREPIKGYGRLLEIF